MAEGTDRINDAPRSRVLAHQAVQEMVGDAHDRGAVTTAEIDEAVRADSPTPTPSRVCGPSSVSSA